MMLSTSLFTNYPLNNRIAPLWGVGPRVGKQGSRFSRWTDNREMDRIILYCGSKNSKLGTNLSLDSLIYPTFQAAKLIHMVPNEYKWLLQIDTNNFCVDLKLRGTTTPPIFVIISHHESSDVYSNPLFITIGKHKFLRLVYKLHELPIYK